MACGRICSRLNFASQKAMFHQNLGFLPDQSFSDLVMACESQSAGGSPKSFAAGLAQLLPTRIQDRIHEIHFSSNRTSFMIHPQKQTKRLSAPELYFLPLALQFDPRHRISHEQRKKGRKIKDSTGPLKSKIFAPPPFV